MASFYKTPTDATVYVKVGNQVRPIASIDDFEKLAGTRDIAGTVNVVNQLPASVGAVIGANDLPDVQTALSVDQQLQPQLEAVNLAEQKAKSTYDLLNEQSRANRSGIEQEIADAIKAVNKNQTEQEQGFLNQQSDLGLLQSGLTAGGLGDIKSSTTQNLNRLELARANKLAEEALRMTGAGQDLASAIRTAEIQRGQIAQTAAGTTAEAIQARQQRETVAKQQEFENTLKLLGLSQDLPAGQEFDIPGYGKITGSKVQAEAVTKLFENPFSVTSIPDDILRQLLQSYGFTVTD